LEDLAGLEWDDEEVTTIGGYVVRRLGHLSSQGEQLRLNGYDVTVEQTDGRRVPGRWALHRLQIGAIEPLSVKPPTLT
jgi:Mg2+/Co2+ transporter CorC